MAGRRKTNTTHTGRGHIERRRVGDVSEQKHFDDIRNKVNDLQSMLGGLEGMFKDTQKGALQFRRTDTFEIDGASVQSNTFKVKIPHRLSRPYEGAIIVEESRPTTMGYVHPYVFGPTGEEADIVEVRAVSGSDGASGVIRCHLLVY